MKIVLILRKMHILWKNRIELEFFSENGAFADDPTLKITFRKQEMQRKLEPNVKWISDMAIHSSGDHIIVGDYSTRLAWIDTGESYYMTSFHDM